MSTPRLSALTLLLWLGMLTPGVGARAQPPRAHWVMTFDEEFGGHTLDARKWSAGRGPSGIRENPVQYYLPDAVAVGQGRLTIRSEPRSVGGYPFTSGDISTLNKFAQCYGRFVVRCRFPRLAGTWSAIYLLPASGTWPPEIDITEFVGRDPNKVFLTNHWLGQFGHQQQNYDDWDPSVDWTQWHVYQVDWEPGVIRWTIDGRLCGTATEGVAAVPMYLRLNTAIGGAFAGAPSPSGWPQTFQVDYVRVYRRLDLPAPVLGLTALPAVASGSASAAPQFENTPPGASNLWTTGDGWLIPGLILLWVVTAYVPPKSARMTAVLAVTVGLTACFYLVWRAEMIGWDAWGIALPLFAAELFGILQVLGFQYTVWPRAEPTLTTGEDATRRPIFILIPTVNEGREVVEPTVRGALAARDRYLRAHPGAEVSVAICNDGRVGNDPDWREMEELAADTGILCLTRTVGGGAKAGNLEQARQALGATGEALIALFDADMVAEPEFLLETVPPFDDPGVGWVQTGQYYRNLDNPVVRWAHDQQMVFFEALCPGKARLNACFICGTNVVIRAAALDEIGGLPQDSVTEDFAASLLLHPRWRSVYLPRVLATGLGPADLPAYFTQQRRWATGTLDVLCRQWRRIFLPGPGGLRPAQRVQYALSATHYLGGLCQAVFLLAPLLYLLAGLPALRPVGLPDFFRHFVPFLLSSQLAYWYACGRRLRWRGTVLGFGSFPVLVMSLLSVLLGRRARFVVTAKRRRVLRSWHFLLPHACALLAGLAGLVVALDAGDQADLLWISALWVAVMMLMLVGVLRLAIADRAEEEPEALPPRSLSRVSALAESADRRRQQTGGNPRCGRIVEGDRDVLK